MRSGAAKIWIGGLGDGPDPVEEHRKRMEAAAAGLLVPYSSQYEKPLQGGPTSGARGGKFVFDRSVETFADFKNRVNTAYEVGSITRAEADKILKGVLFQYDDQETRKKQWKTYESNYDEMGREVLGRSVTGRFVDWWRCDNKTGGMLSDSFGIPRMACYARNFLVIAGVTAGWFVLMSLTKVD